MDTHELEAAMNLLLNEADGDLGDNHEFYMRLRQTVDSMRAVGMPVPEDFLRLERQLEASFEADRDGK